MYTRLYRLRYLNLNYVHDIQQQKNQCAKTRDLTISATFKCKIQYTSNCIRYTKFYYQHNKTTNTIINSVHPDQRRFVINTNFYKKTLQSIQLITLKKSMYILM